MNFYELLSLWKSPYYYEMYENFGKHADVILQRALTISGMISIHKKPK